MLRTEKQDKKVFGSVVPFKPRRFQVVILKHDLLTEDISSKVYSSELEILISRTGVPSVSMFADKSVIDKNGNNN